MKRCKITCAGCGKAWTLAAAPSVYEQQALESRPCPRCGGYTLCCHDAADARMHRPPHRPGQVTVPVSRN